MKNYRQLVQELPSKKVVFAFGRFQPPTNGHELLVNAVKKIASQQGADHVIFASRSQDKKSNPLPVDRKVYYLKRMFPRTNFIAANDNIRTFMEAAKELSKKYKHLVMLAGSDRVQEYTKLLNKYNGKEFNFETIEVVSAGERDPDADSAAGMSGTKMREAAKKGDFQSFKKGLPHTLTEIDGKRLMNEIRQGMGVEAIKEQVKFEVTDLREKYHAGEIFNLEEIVESNGIVYQIKKRGSNHLLLQDENGNLVSKWLQDVEQTTKEFKLQEGLLNEMKFTSADKIKVARIIATTLGVKDVEKSSNPEQLVNAALRKIRSLPMRPEYVNVLQKMLQTASEAGINYDEKLVPQKAEAVEEEVVNEISKETLKSYIPKAMGSKSAADFTRGVKMAQGSGGEEELRKKSEKRSEGIHAAIKKLTREELGLDEAVQVSHERYIRSHSKPARGKGLWAFTHKRSGDVDYHNDSEFHKASGSFDDAKKSAKIWAKKHGHSTAYVMEEVQIDESYEDAEGHKKQADAAKAKGNLGAYHAHMADHHEAMGQWHESKGRHSAADSQYAKAEEHHNQSLKHPFKEETQIEEGKMGELHDTISRHLDKHISDFKSGHTGHDQFGSKVLAAHKAVAKEHGLEHKHAAKFVNDYVDSKLNEEALDEVSFHTLDKAWHGRYQQALAAKHGSPEHQKAHKSMGKIGDVMKKRTSDKLMHMAKHDPEAYKKSAQQVADDNKKRGWSNEETELVSDLLEQIALAKLTGKSTDDLEQKLIAARTTPVDVKDNESDVGATAKKPAGSEMGASMTNSTESPALRRMKIKYVHEEAEDLEEDAYTSEYTIKSYIDKDGESKTRKVRPHRIEFKNSKANAEPEVKDIGEAMGSSTEDDKEELDTIDLGSRLTKTACVKEESESQEESQEEKELDNLSDADLEKMADSIDTVEEIIDVYDDSELAIVDDETGEHIEDLKEEVLNEILSRSERIKAKTRFAKTKAKRERKARVALKSRSSVSTINARARKLAVKLMKQRIAKKPLDKLSVGEKERLEKVIQRRKAIVNRLAMKLAPRVRKIENDRLTHKHYTK